MTNHERWLSLTNGLSSPDNYIEWGWIYLVCAALQRRVWLGANNQLCFPNINVILVGEPGVGKGLVIKEVGALLRHWKKGDVNATKSIPTELQEQAQLMHEVDLEKAQETEYQGKGKGKDLIKPLLFPTAADSTTFEALVQAMAESNRKINVVEQTPEGPKMKVKSHSSLCFLLPELSSLMRKRTHDTINLILGLYDCPDVHEYRTKHEGRDRIWKGCLNILAGTTPSFLQSTFTESLTDEGFSARTFFIYAKKNRKHMFDIPALTTEQEEHKKILLDHLMKLSQLYGQCQYGEGALEFLREWFEDIQKNPHKRANNSPKLVPYYGRLNIHVMKVAMAMHFGESVIGGSWNDISMVIPKETFQRAIDFLRREELTMHMAIEVVSNKMSKLTKKIVEGLRAQPLEIVPIYAYTHGLYEKMTEVDDALEYLLLIGEVKKINEDDPNNKEQTITKWKLV